MDASRSATLAIRVANQQQLAANRQELERLLTDAIGTSAMAVELAIDDEVANCVALTRRTAGCVTVIAEVNGRLCGALIAEVAPDKSSAFIRWVAVSPNHRRQRIGTKLMDHFEQAVQPDLVRGMVDLDDPAATAFWNERGWRSLVTPRRRISMGRRLHT